jgi:hypothetical protein
VKARDEFNEHFRELTDRLGLIKAHGKNNFGRSVITDVMWRKKAGNNVSLVNGIGSEAIDRLNN